MPLRIERTIWRCQMLTCVPKRYKLRSQVWCTAQKSIRSHQSQWTESAGKVVLWIAVAYLISHAQIPTKGNRNDGDGETMGDLVVVANE